MKDVRGFEGLYAITEGGKVWSHPKRFQHKDKQKSGQWLSLTRKSYGYVTVIFVKDGKYRTFRVHRLVGETFLKNDRKLPFINHKNGIRHDNRITNLEWVTSAGNRRHAIKRGSVNGKLSIEKARKIREEYKRGKRGFGATAIANRYGVCRDTIRQIIANKIWKEE